MALSDIDLDRLFRLRFKSKVNEKQAATNREVEAVTRDYWGRGLAQSGMLPARLARIQTDGVPELVEEILRTLERDSRGIAQSDVDSFWGRARSVLGEEITTEFRRRSSSVRQQAGKTMVVDQRVLDAHFSQHLMTIKARLAELVEEIRMSQKLRGEVGDGGGVNINVSNSPGANVNTGHIGGSQTSHIMTSDAAAILDAIRVALRGDSSLAPAARQDALAEVQIIEAQLQKTKPNKRTVRESLDVLAKIASIGGLVLKLSQVLGPALLALTS